MRSTNEYADVREMFQVLNALDPHSRARQQQRDKIVQRCLPLADHLARRYRGRGECLDDLVQVARMGLINAVNRFELNENSEFLSFAVPTIVGEIRRYFRDHGWAVKVPRRIKDLYPQISAATQELALHLHRSPNATEIAEHLGIDREIVVDAMIAGSNYSVLSIDVPCGDGDKHQSILDTVGAPDPRLEKVLNVQTVRPLIAALPERERTVIRLRFFDEMTQTEIADRIGCSQMHVSRLLAQALQKIRSGAHQSDLAAAI
ncbi:SigB/SigF/SigG family RNA polymerase sigma factor [Mycobacterium sp. ML4]